MIEICADQVCAPLGELQARLIAILPDALTLLALAALGFGLAWLARSALTRRSFPIHLSWRGQASRRVGGALHAPGPDPGRGSPGPSGDLCRFRSPWSRDAHPRADGPQQRSAVAELRELASPSERGTRTRAKHLFLADHRLARLRTRWLRSRAGKPADRAPALRRRLNLRIAVLGAAIAMTPSITGAPADPPVVHVAPIEGVIDLGLAPFVRRVLAEAADGQRRPSSSISTRSAGGWTPQSRFATRCWRRASGRWPS